eukprot:jgi/Psemu1/30715/gm1.30715_g
MTDWTLAEEQWDSSPANGPGLDFTEEIQRSRNTQNLNWLPSVTNISSLKSFLHKSNNHGGKAAPKVNRASSTGASPVTPQRCVDNLKRDNQLENKNDPVVAKKIDEWKILKAISAIREKGEGQYRHHCQNIRMCFWKWCQEAYVQEVVGKAKAGPAVALTPIPPPRSLLTSKESPCGNHLTPQFVANELGKNRHRPQGQSSKYSLPSYISNCDDESSLQSSKLRLKAETTGIHSPLRQYQYKLLQILPHSKTPQEKLITYRLPTQLRAYAGNAAPLQHERAIANMICIAFFFYLQPGEYPGTTTDDDQNGDKGKVVAQEALSGDPLCYPVIAVICQLLLLQQVECESPDTTL